MKTLTFLLCVVAVVISFGTATPVDDDGRIVNGMAIKISQAPYMVRLVYSNGYYCGGSLIAKNFVLTAAHCLNNRDPRKYTVIANASYAYEQGIRRSVIDWAVHPKYDADGMSSDNAVLKISEPIEGMRTLKLCQQPLKEGDVVQVSGWGRSAENETSKGVLQTVYVPVRSMDVCVREYNDFVKENMFCASGLKDVGFCSGDSGGPAVIGDQVCGTVAFSFECGVAGHMEVYTSVYDTRDFITNFMSSK